MDIKAKIEEIVKKLEGDKGLLESFKKDPIAAINSLVGVELPEDQLKAIVNGVKGKLKIEKVEEMAEGAVDKIKGLFHKE